MVSYTRQGLPQPLAGCIYTSGPNVSRTLTDRLRKDTVYSVDFSHPWKNALCLG